MGTAGGDTSQYFIRGSGRAAAEYFITTTQDRPGGIAIRADTIVMDRAAPVGMANITVAARVTGAEDTTAGTEDRTDATAGTGVSAGVKGTLQTLYIPKTDSGSSVETRRIATEVGRADRKEGGELDWGEIVIVE